MLSRKDLSKEFELVVKQEIKNYNDTVLATNVSLNDCHKKIDELSEKVNRRFAELDTKLLDKDSKFFIHKESIDRSISQLLKMLGDLDSQVVVYLNNSINLRQSLADNYSLKSEVYNLSDEFEGRLSHLNLKIHQISENFSHKLEMIERSFVDKFDKLKKEILDRPSEAQDVKRELENKINSACIDAEGILKELRILKKDALISEKKIENIYTLIERANNRISECLKQG